MSMECQWNEKVPRQEARRPFGPSRLLLADMSWTSFARCSLREVGLQYVGQTFH